MLTPKLIGKLNVAGNAAISPDGRFIAYVVDDAGRSDLWINSVDGSGEPQQIMQSEEATLTNLVFSKDGNSLYFNQEDKDGSSLYKLSLDAGISAVRLLKNLVGRVALSPDENRWPS